MRVSAGFLVTGLSGNRRIQILPPRLTKRVIATRLASICRSVIQPGSMTFKPKSPNDSSPPRQALPAMRPRCCLRYFTFFGINIVRYPWSGRSHLPDLPDLGARSRPPRRAFPVLFLPSALRHETLTLVQPHLDSDLPVGRVRLGKAVVDVGAERLQWQLAVQVPLGARDFGAVQ